MRNLSFEFTGRSDKITAITAILGKAKVNIRSLAGLCVGERAVMHMMVDDIYAARNALEEGGIDFKENEVVSLLLENRAGELAEVFRALQAEKIAVQSIYVIGLQGDFMEFALAVDDPVRAQALLS
jgi:hypothetical protein